MDDIRKENEILRKVLRDLVDRCDGIEGVQGDGSNMNTYDAHAALGDFDDDYDDIGYYDIFANDWES